MRVVAIKAKKISSTKAVLIVKFISPPSLKNVQMQMFCTILEANTKQRQGADLSIMTALTLTNPGAKSLFDLGVCCKPRSETTRGVIAAFDSMLGGTIFEIVSIWQHNETCSRTTLIFLRPLFRVNYCPETVRMARFIFLHRQDMTKMLSTCIASLSHFTACPLQPELGTPP